MTEYARYLQESREELRNLHEDVLINVTRFFRDPPVFEALKSRIFPTLFSNCPADQQVRIWVTGCVTGEEAYTIAICLLEYLAEQSQQPPIQIFGTDASECSIQLARMGCKQSTPALWLQRRLRSTKGPKRTQRPWKFCRSIPGSPIFSSTCQEKERRRVVRESHDDISQKLVVMNMELQRLGRDLPADPAEVQQQLERLRERIASLADEVRRLSHQLHPSAIEHLGLAAALRSLVEEFGEREEMVTTFRRSNVPEKLPPEVAAALYRIAQEALRNVAKHAGRTHVKVLLEDTDEGMRLTVRDLGEGFDPETRGTRSLGLVSMRERARLVGGTFFINSVLGEGTTVTVTVLLPGQAKE